MPLILVLSWQAAATMKISTLHTAVLGLAALAKASYINYTTVTGYFMQDEVSTDPSTFVYVSKKLARI